MSEEVIEQNPIEVAPVTVIPEPAVAEVPEAIEPQLPLEESIEQPELKAPKPKEERKVPVKVMLERVNAKEAQREAAERRAADAEALLEQLQNANREPNAPQPPKQANIDDLVVARAAALRLRDDRTAIINAGTEKFGPEAFNEAAEIAAACGCVSDEFVQDILAVDRVRAHEIYMELAKDPATATNLAGMDSRNRIAALTRMTMTASAKTEAPKPTLAPVKQVSKAPAPAPVVEPSASKVIDGYADDATDEQFTKQFNERMKARSARR